MLLLSGTGFAASRAASCAPNMHRLPSPAAVSIQSTSADTAVSNCLSCYRPEFAPDAPAESAHRNGGALRWWYLVAVH
ncbi:hypothetical protein BFJ69_g7362 [Fusarium oxysporum]|uniref:Uncharacterized protein n=1 Tax=Fusarium oxysporum TaxID=5507 RepID=A0A420N6J3_FUSOX|nr:hypothetical protein BFJ69_g7362 [Fusarium oxysporum]